ncbi:aspartate ammonia-lyase [Rhodococcus sp. G-MC3]|uniref:aspartate ammonia-lyase n=1 Tax=Rhodococcus sp. G-MC3 TaxID=3046209 RepID=UPI0024B9E2C3|nr:aspartate ammonia-lyase [Rhodococcus sp. G-MC3]MDJ0394851.1 aspartate ammonia-lyase [Rhodococcus sp. G-MC3]
MSVSTNTTSAVRFEHDLLGEKPIPVTVLYGVHTARALENFTISGTPISHHTDLVDALVSVKQAAALTNQKLGLLDDRIAAAIVAACKDIRAGNHHEHFVVDVIQGGAGTSTNMNANEVVANLALDILGVERGRYDVVHPLEHVNLGQSTNDVYPTAVKIALQYAIRRLTNAMDDLAQAFSLKSVEFGQYLKMGRTQLQDAVPMTLGQEFGTYAVMVGEDAERLGEAALLVAEINLGGTAIGTGLNTHPAYTAEVCEALRTITALPLSTATNLVEATQDVGSFVQLSGVLKRTAVKLSKVCNDLRLLSSGPRVGLGEINLPAVQAGSSIMPGKVNPVIPEVVNQVAFRVIGHDVTVSIAAEGGQLQLNAFEPVIAHSLFSSLAELTAACEVLTNKCVVGITANVEHMRGGVERSIGLATAMSPLLGYDGATRVATTALATGRLVTQIVLEQNLLTAEQLDAVLDPDYLTGSGRVRAATAPREI